MPRAYLTIDDAPTPELPAKLDHLRETAVPALLFCEGRRLAAVPDIARAAVTAGFHLGNHAYSHTHASDLTVDAFRDEIVRTERLIETCYADVGIERPARVFRFPYGDKGGEHRDVFQEVLTDFDFVPPDRTSFTYEWYHDAFEGDLDWRWTVDFNDWKVDSPEGLAAEIEAADERIATPSPDIMLFHDAGNDLDCFAACVDMLVDAGVHFADPLELLDERAVEPPHDPRCAVRSDRDDEGGTDDDERRPREQPPGDSLDIPEQDHRQE